MKPCRKLSCYVKPEKQVKQPYVKRQNGKGILSSSTEKDRDSYLVSQHHNLLPIWGTIEKKCRTSTPSADRLYSNNSLFKVYALLSYSINQTHDGQFF